MWRIVLLLVLATSHGHAAGMEIRFSEDKYLEDGVGVHLEVIGSSTKIAMRPNMMRTESHTSRRMVFYKKPRLHEP